MKWIAISGSWQKINKKIEKDIRGTVREIISRGDGIVSGGALNSDYVATDEALKVDSDAKRIKIFLPSPLEVYAAHQRQLVKEKIINFFIFFLVIILNFIRKNLYRNAFLMGFFNGIFCTGAFIDMKSY